MSKDTNFQSVIYDTTVNMLENRSRLITFEKIESDTGLNVRWLQALLAGKFKDPGVKKIETLFHYLQSKL